MAKVSFYRGETVPSTTVDGGLYVTSTEGLWINDGGTKVQIADITPGAASTTTDGLMSASDKSKLDGIASGANKYSHPTSAGNKHIPSGGSSGQILRWSASGTAVWGADNNTTYSAGTGISISSGNAISNSGVRSISSGSTNGTISVNTNGSSAEVAVKGLGSAAYTASTAYATSGHNHDDRYYTETEVDAKFDAIMGEGAAESLDTISEISAALKNNAGIIDTLNEAIGAKQATITGGATTITSSNLTANRALISNGSGKVAVSAVTSTELGYLDGVTSAIQTQLNNKAASSTVSGHTGNGDIHVTAAQKTNWNAAYTHSTSTHAPTNAQPNQNAWSNITVGSTTVAADTTTDTLTLVGSNVTLTPDATNDKITIGITKSNVTTALGYTPPTKDTTYGAATTSTAGLMSAADKSKLDGIAEGANNYTYTLPTASTTLGGVKTTSTVTTSSGFTPCPIISGVVYYKDTNTTTFAASAITSGTLGVARGGTGITSNPSMLVNLGSTSAASVFAASPRPGITGTLPIANGGTGATAKGTTLLSNIGITSGTADAPATGTPGTIYIQYI